VTADTRVKSVTVAVRKLRPPTPVQMATAGVTITRQASDEAASRAVARDVAEILVAEGGGLRRRAFLGLGSNLGDREANLRAALAALPGVSAVSPVYETEPVGGPPGQGPFLNLVVELDTDLSPRALLRVAKRLEEAAGRRPGPRNGPRPLDVDVLLVGDLVVDEPDLVVPHPRMRERRFVLRPLADLAPELVPEAWEATATGAVRSLGSL
jgi:2-amino-4-hydroxy-6-hydroxymethyldihydropteridine diphosphokinase